MRRLTLHLLLNLLLHLRRLLSVLRPCEEPPHVVFGAEAAVAPEGLLVHLPFGDHLPLPGSRPDESSAQRVTLDVQDLGRLPRVLRFAHRRRLPVAAWVIHDLHRLPLSTRRQAAFVARLAVAAGGTTIVVDTRRLSADHQRRLVAHLSRLGCKAERDPLSKTPPGPPRTTTRGSDALRDPPEPDERQLLLPRRR